MHIRIIEKCRAAGQGYAQALTHPAVRRTLQERGIVLTTWKELMARRAKAAPLR